MKYKRCLRCGLNYVTEDQQYCKVCRDEMDGRKSIFDMDGFDEIICPYCEKNPMGIDDIMCDECRRKRAKRGDNL